jgi:putative oxidoreductase
MFSTFFHNALVPLLLRLVLAAIFIFHGLSLIGGPDQEWGARWNTAPDAPPAALQFVVAWAQLIGGVALGLGFLTRLAALGIIAIMVGAIATVHWPHGFDITKGGYEYNVAIIVMCVCLVLGGPGPLAVDRFFRVKRQGA